MIRTISRPLGYLAGAALLAIALAICLDILMRWLLNMPIKGMYEISQLVFACLLALGFATANARREHVAMELAGLLTRNRSGLTLVASLLTTCVFGLLVWLLFRYAADKAAYGETTLVLGLPLAPFWYMAATLLLVSFAVQCGVLLQDAAALRGQTRRALLAAFALPVAAVAAVAAVALLMHVEPPWMGPGILVLLGFALLYLLAGVHLPIGVAMAIAGMLGALAVLGPAPALLIGQRELTGTLSSADLAAIPLFLVMGNLAIAAGFADDIFDVATMAFGRVRGGHSIATIIGCAGFGAISGSSIATTATIGRVAFREMQQRDYALGLSTGSVAAGGTLGALVPPSVILIIYCVIAEQSIAVSFIAALVPGLLALLLYVAAVAIQVRLNPDAAPRDPAPGRFSASRALARSWRPAALFALIVGGLYGGVFTVQEAAAVGVGLSFVFWLLSGRAALRGLGRAVSDAVATSAMLYLLIVGASIFGAFLNIIGVTSAILSVIDPATTPVWLILGLLVAMYLVLGSAFDSVAALLVTVPFVVPVIVALDYDLVWWGIITLTLVEIGMITPPIGMNVFVMKAMVGDEVPITTIFRGVVPFLIADAVRLTLLIGFPALSLWLPSIMH